MERTSAPNASAERGRHETGPICSMAFAMTGSRRAISCVAAARLHLGMAKRLPGERMVFVGSAPSDSSPRLQDRSDERVKSHRSSDRPVHAVGVRPAARGGALVRRMGAAGLLLRECELWPRAGLHLSPATQPAA